ncbi:hypothetical protein JXA40_04885 [bacterium]|nr:hypothetical protein [candidate division CSSED10-310 bacterium]
MSVPVNDGMMQAHEYPKGRYRSPPDPHVWMDNLPGIPDRLLPLAGLLGWTEWYTG